MAEEMKADRRLWQTAAGRLVEDGDPKASRLVASAGGTIPAKLAARLGLKLESGKVTQGKPPAPEPVASTAIEPDAPEQPAASPEPATATAPAAPPEEKAKEQAPKTTASPTSKAESSR